MMTDYETAPYEWWVCAASDYNTDDPADCCPELCGKPGCAYKETGKPPEAVRTLAFDLEIARPFPADGDWHGHDLGVSCAAVARGSEIITWKGHGNKEMSILAIMNMIAWLVNRQSEGWRIATYNGVGFDFSLLAELVPEYKSALQRLARDSYDPGFQMVAQMGYMIKLAVMAKGLGLPGKLEGMQGDLAPFVWTGDLGPVSDEQRERLDALGVEPGTTEAQDLCVQYVEQDARATLATVLALEKAGHVYWTTKKGTRSRKPFRVKRLLTVRECLELPLPNTSWMTDPRPRSNYVEWLEEQHAEEREKQEAQGPQQGGVSETPRDPQSAEALRFGRRSV